MPQYRVAIIFLAMFMRRTKYVNEELEKKIDDFIADENHRIIIGGDFNVVNDPDLDCSGGTPKEKESIKFLNSICLSYDLIDIWRTRNPDRKLFTWKQKNPLVQRRLDFWPR